MRRLHRLLHGVLALFSRRRAEAELDEELRQFLDASIEAKLAAGMRREDAGRAARLELGSAAAVKDWTRDAGWESRLESLWQDTRYAARILRRSPGFALAAIATFTLGIGANTAIFSVVDAAILRPLPYPEPDRLVDISFENPSTGRRTTGMMPRDFLDWRERQQVFERIALEGGGSVTLLGAGEPEQLRIARVTEGLFEMLRVRPRLGRVFTRQDEAPGAPPVVILSHGFWQTRFGGAADVIGRSLRLDRRPHEIVGVLPQAFIYPAGSRTQTPLFVPFTFTAQDRQHGVVQSMGYSPGARLRDGVTIAQAEALMSDMQAAADAQKKAFNKGYTRVVLRPQMEGYIGTARPWMLTLLGAVTIVLLIACANVANLIIAHGSTRARELTIRGALGAGRWRIARQLLSESLLLATIGGVLGIALAWWGIAVIRSLPGAIPRGTVASLDLRVLGFTAGVTFATGLLCGLVPAFQGSRVDLVSGLKQGAGHGATGGRASRHVRSAIAWLEVALAVVLLVGAGLFVSSFARLLQVDLGFDASRMMSLHVSLPRTESATGGRQPEYDATTIPAMLESIRSLPGVTAAVIGSGSEPFAGGYSSFPVRIAGRPELPPDESGRAPSIVFRSVSTGFLEMLRVPVRLGRVFAEADMRHAPPVAVVNESAARQFWPGESPLGTRLTIQDATYEIVGVVGDMRYMGPDQPVRPEAYLPYEETRYSGGTFLVRAGDDPMRVLPAVKNAIWSVNQRLPIQDVSTAEELFSRTTLRRRFNMLLMSVFAALALVVAATGIYGVIAFAVTHRTREIGVRMALGANAAAVVRMFVRQGAALVLTGIAGGLLGAWWLAQTVRSFLFEVQPRDPIVFGVVACSLAAVGLLACWMPARRAARVDPLIALRAE